MCNTRLFLAPPWWRRLLLASVSSNPATAHGMTSGKMQEYRKMLKLVLNRKAQNGEGANAWLHSLCILKEESNRKMYQAVLEI